MSHLDDRTLVFGARIATALVGLDALWQRQFPDDRDGLVILNLSPESVASAPFTDVAAARAHFRALQQEATALPEPDRRLYYQQVCTSALTALQWCEEPVPLAEQIKGYLHLEPSPASDTELGRLRSQMRETLADLGFLQGSLADQCAAWEAKNRLPEGEVPGVVDALLAEAWDRTEQWMEIPVPRGDGMQVVPVREAHFNARCDFQNRRIELNVDPILTRAGLKHLVCHEAYPGHFVHFATRLRRFHDGLSPADGLLSTLNSASSCTFEGLGDYGPTFLDWLDADDRFFALMTRYRSGLGTDVAWRLHHEGWSVEAATDWLRQHTLVGGEGWVANRIRYISATQRAARIWSYWRGEPSIAAGWARVVPAQHAAYVDFLYGRMHSPQTVLLFEPTAAN